MDQVDALNRFYDEALTTGGNDAQKVGWDSEASQPLRFEALLQVMRAEDWGPSVRLLDVGCGLGDLVPWLKATGREACYTGIDINPEMIRIARERYPGERFEVADLFELNERYDVVVCAGAMGVRFGTEADNWRFVRRLFELGRRAVSFNLLMQEPIAATSELSNHYWHIDPGEAIAAVARLTPRFVMRSDVTPADLVVYLYHEYAPILEGAYPRLTPPSFSADMRLHWGEPDLALAALEASGDAPSPQERSRALCMRGYALYQQQKVDEATANLTQALALDPANFEAGAGLLRMQLGEQRFDDAQALVDRLIQATACAPSRGDWLRSLVHKALIDKGQFEQARTQEGLAVTAHGRCLMVGQRLLSEGELTRAESTLQAAVVLRPDDRRADLALAWVFLRQERYPEALKVATSVLDDFPKQADARGVALMCLQRLDHLDDEARLALLLPLNRHAVMGRIVGRMVDRLYSPKGRR